MKKETGADCVQSALEVMNSLPRARTRVDGLRPSGSQSGKSILPSCSQSTGACARTREGLPPIRDREAYFRAWRTATFGGDFDPVRVAVDEAVAAFSCGKLPAGRDWDRREWLKIANRVGVENFHDAFRQMLGRIDELADARKRLRNPAASFQKLLNKLFPRPKAGDGLESRTLSEFINSGSAAGAKGLSAVVGEAAKAGGAA